LSEIVEVPAEAFSSLVESYLNGNYRLYLIVEEMPEKKTFSCKEKSCGLPFDAYPPDDAHTDALLDPTKDAVERSYKCPDGHENTLYWVKPPSGVFVATKR